jgi:protein-S-isoprenylcysteine O-methyltransferase Ste14
MIILGEALVAGSAPLVVYWAVWFAAVNVFVMGFEEPMLQRQFGRAYEDYTGQVRRWIPTVRPGPVTSSSA